MQTWFSHTRWELRCVSNIWQFLLCPHEETLSWSPSSQLLVYGRADIYTQLMIPLDANLACCPCVGFWVCLFFSLWVVEESMIVRLIVGWLVISGAGSWRFCCCSSRGCADLSSFLQLFYTCFWVLLSTVFPPLECLQFFTCCNPNERVVFCFFCLFALSCFVSAFGS